MPIIDTFLRILFLLLLILFPRLSLFDRLIDVITTFLFDGLLDRCLVDRVLVDALLDRCLFDGLLDRGLLDGLLDRGLFDGLLDRGLFDGLLDRGLLNFFFSFIDKYIVCVFICLQD